MGTLWVQIAKVANDNKHLILKGKNNDIWFIQKRVPESIQFLVGKKFIKESLKTSDVKEARQRRDEILQGLKSLELRSKEGEFNILLDKYNKFSKEQLEQIRETYTDQLRDEYPWFGHPQQGTLPNPSKKDMLELEAMESALSDTKPEKYKLTLSQAMELNWKYKDYTHSTHLNHRKAVERFNKFMGVKDIQVHKIKRIHVLEFIKYLAGIIDSNATIQRYLADLAVVWTWARDYEELTIANPFEKHGIKVKRTRKSYKSWHIDDLKQVVSLMKDKRDRLMVYLAWYTGSRLGECLSVRPEDIYIDKISNVWVVSIKPDDEEREYISRLDESAKTEYSRRIVPIHDALLVPLKEFKLKGTGWKRATPNAYSNYFGRTKRKLKQSVNPISKQFSFHSIRHNVATNFQRAGVVESIAARLVGHSTVGATMTYGYYSEGEELQNALIEVNKLPIL